MKQTLPDFNESLKSWAAEEAGKTCGHIALETLRNYHARQLDETEREAVRDHIALCKDCAQVLLGFAGQAEEDPTELQQNRDDWNALKKAFAECSEQTDVENNAGQVINIFRRVGFLQILAASFFICAIGLGVINQQLSSKIKALAASGTRAQIPQTNLQIIELVSEKDQTRGKQNTFAMSPEDHGGLVGVVFTFTDTTEYGSYFVELYDPNNELVFKRNGLKKVQDNSFRSLIFMETFREAGTYRFQLRGRNSGEVSELGTYLLLIQAP